MNQRRSIPVVIVLLVLMSLVLTSSGALAQSGATGVTIPYSSRLTDEAGQPVADGKYDVQFALYDAKEGGQLLWSETQLGITVQSGALDVSLGAAAPISKDVREQKELWLAVSVRGPLEASFTLLNPRQRFNVPASPSALTCPHTHFTDYWGGANTVYGVEVDNGSGTGDGIRGYSGSTAYNYAGVYAVNGGGTSGGGGGSGVYGSSSNGYGAYFSSNTYRGLYATGGAAWYAGYIENPSGSTNTGLYVNGTLWVTGAKTGYVTDAAINDGPEPLETGDVVVISGVAQPIAGEIPVIRVRKATVADSTAVAGVVDQGVVMQQGPQDKFAIPGVVGHEAHLADKTAIQPGEYLLIVTLGAYKGVKVDATRAPIHAGDLLVASGSSGYAASSADPKFNTVIGKALGELKSGTGLVAVLVTLK